jgi:hypothetical protein
MNGSIRSISPLVALGVIAVASGGCSETLNPVPEEAAGLEDSTVRLDRGANAFAALSSEVYPAATIGPVTYPHSCGPQWTCSYISKVANNGACIEVSLDPLGGGNPAGMAKWTHVIQGYNTCRDPASEARGGDPAWHADWKGNGVSCPSFVLPNSDVTFGTCCNLATGECQ